MREDALDPIQLPDSLWDEPRTVAALRDRRVGYLFALARKYIGASQTRIANVTGMDQSQVSRISHGDRRVTAIDVLERVAFGLSMPARARVKLGLAPTASGSDDDIGADEVDADHVSDIDDVGGAGDGAVGERRRPTRARRRTLPVPMTELVGRTEEIARVAELLAARRLVTLAGAPGIGKTRLAVEVAESVLDRFPGGVTFVSLAEADSPGRVVSAIARTLDLTEDGNHDLLDRVSDHLAMSRMLLILDNFEHVLDAAPLIGTMLVDAPSLTVLVSSRERLRISGEQVFPVPPLPLPDRAASSQVAAGSAAVELFQIRANAVNSDFAIGPANAGAVAELMHRLDGLPLAIELAAARVGTLTPQELLVDLGRRIDLCARGPRDVPARHQTLRAAIEYSFALLPAAEQALIARLSVFVGGCLSEAAAIVCAPEQGDTPGGFQHRLAGLVEKNLLRVQHDPEGRTRYLMLETIRTYAAELLDRNDEADAVHARHAEYYAAFATRAQPELFGPERITWLGRIDREYTNLRAVLDWSMAHGHVEPAATIAWGLQRYWSTGRYIGEGRRWYERILAAADQLPADLRVRVRLSATHIACWQGELDLARRIGEDGLREATELGDRYHVGRATNLLGLVAIAAADYERAQALLEQTLDIAREDGDERSTAVALGNLGKIARRTGDFDAAHALYSESLTLYRAVGDIHGVHLNTALLGSIRIWQGRPDAARPLVEEGLAMSRRFGERFIESMGLHDLGRLAAMSGNLAEATSRYAAALRIRREIDDKPAIAESLEALGGLAIAAQPRFATSVFGAAAAVRERVGRPVAPDSQEALQEQLALLHAVLDAETFDGYWFAGCAEALDQIIGRVLSWTESDSPAGTAGNTAGTAAGVIAGTVPATTPEATPETTPETTAR